MSRIGNKPIAIPSGVQIQVSNENLVTVKGGKGELQQEIPASIKIEIEENQVKVTREDDSKQNKAYHGLYRSLIANMVEGVSEGFTIKLELVGVGFKCSAQGQMLDLSLGHSHNIVFELPQEIKVETVTEKGKTPLIILQSHDKQLLGQVASKIRSYRKPEPYKGKGVKYENEYIRRKAGKAAVKQ
ncbi:MAG: 50S ribosomal protein L6 [Marinilabiliales bacterium]|nr:MAG: 50S ribosomal protein L6 [Marinilabiliales bacterium]